MDIAWKCICESISLSGPHGIKWDQIKTEFKVTFNVTESQIAWPPSQPLKYLLTIYAGLAPDYLIGKPKSNTSLFQKYQRTKLMFFVNLEPVDLETFLTSPDPQNFHFYCTNPSIRLGSIFQGRPIQLSESSQQTLELIASHGRNGVTQAELAKLLGCDSKNAFHWLKSLISNDLIARTPVAAKKSFTYLLTLTRFLDEDLSISHQIAQTHTVVSSKEIRQNIVDILAKAPNQTMVSKDVFAQTGLDHLLIKNFRRAAAKLNEIGWLEYLFEDQLVGPYCRLFRLKRTPAEGLDLKSFLASREESKKLEVQPLTYQNIPRGSDFNPDQPIIHQIILLLAHSFPEPMTTTDISHRLNISRKYLYKIIERILPVSERRTGVIGAEGVGKVSDFVGKEKRLKLFIKSEAYRDNYLKIFSSDLSEIVTRPVTPSTPSTPATQMASVPQSPTSSISQVSSANSDTRTRQLRHQAILQELSEKRILEVGKDLAYRIQTRLGDTRFTLDVKTLRRSVEILEREGHLKVIIATIPAGTRTILIPSDLDASDSLVQDHINNLNEYVRTGPLSASTQKLIKLKEIMQQPDFFVEGSLPLGIAQIPSINMKALLQFGFIYGVLVRAQIFHKYLLDNSTDGSFETIPIVFERMPLDVYLKIIGTVRLSRALSDNLKDLSDCSLCELPEAFREELGLNRKRFQSQAAMLLQTLEQLKLIHGEDQYASLNFKLPLKYNFALEIPVYGYTGEIKSILKYGEDNWFEQYWESMRRICVDFHNRTVSIFEENDNINFVIPKPILLARYSDSWKQNPSRERDLERAIKKLLIRRPLEDDLKTSLQELALEFEVSFDRVQEMFLNFQRILEEKNEAKQLDKIAKKRKADERIASESESETSDEDLEHLRWTPEDWQKLSLAFVILQQPIFLGATGIKWNFATQIFDKPKSAIIIRRHGLKLFKGYQELRRLLELDTIVQLLMKGTCIDPTAENFKTIYDTCQSELSALNDSSIFDNFIISDDENTVVIESRQDHYLNTIESWVQTRSFRHGLLLNNPGIIHERSHEEKPQSSNTALLLRQILIYTNSESFDYERIMEILKSIPSEDLTTSIDHLVLTNFASKNRSRDKNRLFGYPLVISDPVRSVVEHNLDDSCEDGLVTNQTETLNINKIEKLIDDAIEGTVSISIKGLDESILKFDAPIEINRVEQETNPLDLNVLYENLMALWFTPRENIPLPIIAGNCLSHLQRTIKVNPGITIESLKRRYENILEGFEIDLLLKCLIENGKATQKHSKYYC